MNDAERIKALEEEIAELREALARAKSHPGVELWERHRGLIEAGGPWGNGKPVLRTGTSWGNPY